MCFYDRVDYDCGHNEWGKMKMQCTRYWQKCCIRKSHDAYVHTMPGLCRTCVKARTIKSTDTLDLTIRIKPVALYTEASYRGSINGEAQKVATHQTPEMLKAHINECIQEYQRINNLPRDSIEIVDKANKQQQVQQAPPTGLGDCAHPKDVFCSRELKRSQVQMMYLEEQNRRRCALIETETESKQDTYPGKHVPNEYERILAQLERQNAKRLRMARQDSEAEQKAHHGTAEGNATLQDYQMQLMKLESSKRAPGNTHDLYASKDKLAEYQYKLASERCQPGRTKNASTSFLSDFEPQLRLLEEQQKKRLEQQKNQRSSIERGSPSYYEEQLRLIEEQNKKRLLMARSEQDYIAKDTKLPLRTYSAKNDDKQPANQESEQIMEMGQALACPVGETSTMEQSIFEDSDMEILEKESL